MSKPIGSLKDRNPALRADSGARQDKELKSRAHQFFMQTPVSTPLI
jgi:hypothetical protein